VFTAARISILVSAEDDIIDGEDDDDELDASVETDEGIVTDETAPTGHGEAVTESDAEKVSSLYLCVLHCTVYRYTLQRSWIAVYKQVVTELVDISTLTAETVYSQVRHHLAHRSDAATIDWHELAQC